MGALGLTAILLLNARPAQMAALTAMGTAPAIVLSIFAGVWIDRLRRRPMLIAAEFGRAISLGTIPAAYFLNTLRIEHLYAVAFINGALQVVFMVAHPSYVPSIVGRDSLVEANSKISATSSAVEIGAFGVSGWIAQLVSAIAAAAVNSLTFLVSGLLLLWIRKSEPAPQPPGAPRDLKAEVVDGVRHVWRSPILRPVAISESFIGFADGAIGGMITLFAITEVGFKPGPLGLIYAAGGISSFVGAVYAGRVARRFGVGPAMSWSFIILGLSVFLVPLAPQTLWLAAAFFLTQQLLGDAGWGVHDVTELSLRQAITPDRMRGRVNSAITFTGRCMQLAGAAAAGVIAETAGLRWALAAGATAQVLAGLTLLFSRVGKLREAPEEAA
jgi:MFS family permease